LTDAGSYTFTDVVLKTAGLQTITATDSMTPGLVGSASVIVTAAAPTILFITTPPPSSLMAGQSFSLVVTAKDPYGNLASNFNGTVTVSIPADPAFTATIQAKNGVATFTGLTAATADQGQSIQATASGLTGTTTKPVIVTPAPTPTTSPTTTTPTPTSTTTPTPTPTPAPTPTVTGEQAVVMQKKNKKGKPSGKPVLVGFMIDYSAPMNPSTAGLASNYQMTATLTKKVKKKTVTSHTPVAVTAAYNAANNSVTLTIQGKQTFADGGDLTVIYAPPGGVSSAAGVPLSASDGAFSISLKGTAISLG
jgi:hypothetical protein